MWYSNPVGQFPYIPNPAEELIDILNLSEPNRVGQFLYIPNPAGKLLYIPNHAGQFLT